MSIFYLTLNLEDCYALHRNGEYLCKLFLKHLSELKVIEGTRKSNDQTDGRTYGGFADIIVAFNL